MQFRTLHLVFTLSVLLFAFPWHAARAQAPAMQEFEQGFNASRAGNHTAALHAFLEARRAGMDTPALRYNLGVTYYRLGRYAEAEREFQALARDAAWAGLAHYNLALTAQRMGRTSQAVEHFERAYRAADEPKLRTLAATALERLGRVPEPPRTGALISLAAGYDSNATLSPDAETVGLSDQHDLFLEALAAASHRLTGGAAGGSYVHGGLLLRKYVDLDRYDQAGFRAGLSYETVSGRWQNGVGAYVEQIYVEDERLQQAGILELRARRLLAGGAGLRARYQFAHIDGGRDFGYLDGWQQRLGLETGFSLARSQLRLGYELELNDRSDFAQGAEFLSYSPTRHTFAATLAWPDVRGWRTEARAEYRLSRYKDPDRLDGGTRVVTREDDRLGVGLRAARAATSAWRPFLDYAYYRNESNVHTHDYNRHQVMLGVELAL